MNDLERRTWWVLRAYPERWRDERGEDLVATVLAMSGPGQRWPSVRVTLDLLLSGWAERAQQHRRAAGGWLAAGWRMATVAAVMLLVVMAVVWLRQWVVDGYVPMLPVLGALSAWTFVVAMGGVIAATATWLAGMARTTRVLATLAVVAWLVTVLVFQLMLSGHVGRVAVLVAWTYVLAMATRALWQPPPAVPVTVGGATVAASLIALATTPSVFEPSLAGLFPHAHASVPHWVIPAWGIAALVAMLATPRDPRWVVGTSLLLPLVVLIHRPVLGPATLGLTSLVLAVLLAAVVGPRAASSP